MSAVAIEERPLGRTSGLNVPAVGMGTWVTLDALSARRCHVAIPAASRSGRVRENAAAGAPPWFDEDVRALAARLVG